MTFPKQLNCVPGDLALIVRSLSGNEGRIVTCVELVETPAWWDPFFPGPVWLIDRVLEGSSGPVQHCADCQLRPIRDSGGTDEMVRRTGVPVAAAVAATIDS